MLMDLKKPFRPQSLAERMEGVVCRDLVAADTDGVTIYSDLRQFVAEFSIG